MQANTCYQSFCTKRAGISFCDLNHKLALRRDRICDVIYPGTHTHEPSKYPWAEFTITYLCDCRDFSSYISGSVYGTCSQWQKVYIFPNFDEKIPNLTERIPNLIICPYRYCFKVELMLLMNPVGLIYV